MQAFSYFSGLCCWLKGFTDLLLSGIVSLPWSPFASLPPEVEVPLPLLSGAMPVVSLGGFAELAAGRGAPGPPALLWAYANVPETASVTANAIVVSLMAKPFPQNNVHPGHRFRSSSARHKPPDHSHSKTKMLQRPLPSRTIPIGGVERRIRWLQLGFEVGS